MHRKIVAVCIYAEIWVLFVAVGVYLVRNASAVIFDGNSVYYRILAVLFPFALIDIIIGRVISYIEKEKRYKAKPCLR